MILFHAGHIFLECNKLALVGRLKHNEILKHILVHSVIVVDAPFKLCAERGVELLVFLAIVLLHLRKLGRDLLFNRLGNALKLTVVLKHFTGDIEREVGAIHKTAHKAEIVGQKILAMLHNEHTARIELQALFIVTAVIIIRRMGRNK